MVVSSQGSAHTGCQWLDLTPNHVLRTQIIVDTLDEMRPTLFISVTANLSNLGFERVICRPWDAREQGGDKLGHGPWLWKGLHKAHDIV